MAEFRKLSDPSLSNRDQVLARTEDLLFRKSASLGDADGMCDLGGMYEEGFGVPKDAVKAVYWYNKAALKGDPKAVSVLGLMYLNGEGGLPRDGAKAVACFRLAASADAGVPIFT